MSARRRKKNQPTLPEFRMQWDFLKNPMIYIPAGVIILVVLIVLIYLPSIDGKFLLDDDNLLTDNVTVHALDGLYRIWFTKETIDYWPVTNSSFWFEWRCWGVKTTGYHVTNVCLHTISCLLFWLVLRKMSIPGAFLAAVLFAVHPVNVESIAWISQRKNALAMVFFLLSIYGFIAAELKGKTWATELYPRGTIWWHVFSLVMFVLAMLGKGSVAILPAVLLLIIFWRRKVALLDAVRLAPFFFVAVVLVLVNIWFQNRGEAASIRNIEFLGRLLQAGAVPWFYLYKAFLPVHLAFVYPQWTTDTANWLWWIPLTASIAATGLLFWQRQTWWGRPLLFTWLFFCISLLPIMGFTDVGLMRFTLVADHYQHIALLGITALAASAAYGWRARSSQNSRRAASITTCFVVLSLTVLAYRQSALYTDVFTLYSATIEENPRCPLLLNELGRTYYRYHNDPTHRNDNVDYLAASKKQFELALEADKGYPEAYNNLATVYIQMKQMDDAIFCFKKALQLSECFANARANLAKVFVMCGRYPEAFEQYDLLLKAHPNNAAIVIDYCKLLIDTGKPEQAYERLKETQVTNPLDPNLENWIGVAQFRLGLIKEAIETFKKAIAMAPNYDLSHFNLALVYQSQQQMSDAIGQLQETIRLNPLHIDAMIVLADTQVKTGRMNEGVLQARKAAEIARKLGNAAAVERIEEWLKAQSGSSAPSSPSTPSVLSPEQVPSVLPNLPTPR